MELKLNQVEIEAALVEYISSQGIDTTEKTIEVTMTAGRKGNGFSADISIYQGNKKEAGLPGETIMLEETDTVDAATPLFTDANG